MAATGFFRDVSDPYSRRARLYPGLIITLPISILTIVLVTSVPTWWSAAVVVFGASGVSYLGAQLVRSAGRGKQSELWASWGGAPTTQLLRFRDASNRVTVKRRHDELTRLFPDLAIPDESMEAANPSEADQYYETAIGALIERTSDASRFPLVFNENCQYGFRRNLWGCRTLGIWLAATGLAVTAVLGGLDSSKALTLSILGIALSGGLDIILLLVLILAVTPAWVRQAAGAYAERLLATLDSLAASRAS
jgi:hypothetical protein